MWPFHDYENTYLRQNKHCICFCAFHECISHFPCMVCNRTLGRRGNTESCCCNIGSGASVFYVHTSSWALKISAQSLTLTSKNITTNIQRGCRCRCLRCVVTKSGGDPDDLTTILYGGGVSHRGVIRTSDFHYGLLVTCNNRVGHCSVHS